MLRLRDYLITGLLVWLPVVITGWLLFWLVGAFDRILYGLLLVTERLWPAATPLAERLQHVPGLGAVLVAAVLFATGVFVTNMFGQWLLARWDALIVKIPIVRFIYSGVKQVSDRLFSGSGQAFSKALLVPYPHPGSWTVGFLTGKLEGQLAKRLPGEHISVFVPTTPNPTSGFLLMVRTTDVRELDLSVDEAFKYLISLGVATPDPRVEVLPAGGRR